MMDPAVIIILLLYRIDSTQAVRNSEPLVISAEPGEAVNLTCTFVDDSDKEVRMWYKQRLEHAPLEVGSKLEDKPAVISGQLNTSRFKLNRIASGISLSIERVTKEDEGMYFCVATGKKTLNFSTATFLAVTGQSDISVLQTPVQGSVSPGESVTLQCTVLSEIRAADLRVLWFRAAAGQSFPEIIYTHQNSSSRQCEISSSTSCSLYEFSKNILDHNHTGTYYCAVAACGKIIFGNGTSVELTCPVDPTVFYLGAALGICVIVICVQAIGNCSGRDRDSVVENKASQNSAAAVELSYAAKSLRMKSGRSGHSVYSEVRYFSVTDPNSH
uniref:Ig-like domain-containing protein n=1 Tax=Pygocentrus nattereri TaxID=42514 RepID=A0A3B4E424_PYGNA